MGGTELWGVHENVRVLAATVLKVSPPRSWVCAELRESVEGGAPLDC